MLPQKLHFYLTLISFLVFNIGNSNGQAIKGRIIDAETKSPVANASIYLNGTTIGTSSDQDGNFYLPATKSHVPLVISCINYESQILNNYNKEILIISLKPKSKQLNDVVITGQPVLNRQTELDIFLREFIGPERKTCTISNLDAIHFKYQKKSDSLTAWADQPLIIYNKKLGYKITYYLLDFKKTPKEVAYQGTYFFKEDTATLAEKDVKKIIRARSSAYLGSRMHFIRALWENKLDENGFELFDSPYQFNARPVNRKDIVLTEAGKKSLALKKEVFIIYNSSFGQASEIRMPVGQLKSVIDSNGFAGPELLWSGSMSEQRISQLLPFEYQPRGYSNYSSSLSINQAAKVKYSDSLLTRLFSSQLKRLQDYTTEKFYLQLDRDEYNSGDTLWFKSYLLNGLTFKASDKSKLGYIEITNENNMVCQRRTILLKDGMGSGCITLNKEDFPEGIYTIRAYTQWMRNFAEPNVFTKQFEVIDIKNDHLLINYSVSAEDNTSKIRFKFNQLKKIPGTEHPVTLQIRQNGVLTKSKQIQNPLSSTPIDLTIADEKKNAPIFGVIQNQGDDKAYTFPINTNNPENIDIQFMTEGGNLITGVASKVAFKAQNELGEGVDIKGVILTGHGKSVTSFQSEHKGMGNFILTPGDGELYFAEIELSGGKTKRFQLPKVKTKGTALSIDNKKDVDSLSIKIYSTDHHEKYILIGQEREVICYASRIDLNNRDVTELKIDKNIFSTGVIKFTLINEQHDPLNDRMIYINRDDRPKVSITQNRQLYLPHDSVQIQLKVTDKDGDPIRGHFSVSVTNASKMCTACSTASIASYLLLSSDLGGYVEDAGFYLSHQPGSYNALDNLLLTQTCTRLNWNEIFTPVDSPAFKPENGINVSGKVKGLNKKVDDVKITIMGIRPFFANQIFPDKFGFFQFQQLPVKDSSVYILHAVSGEGEAKSYSIDINLPEWPVFSRNQTVTPWYVNMDALQQRKADSIETTTEKLSKEFHNETMLNEVVIKAKKIVKSSHNLNGPGNADQVIDSKDLLKVGDDVTLLEILQQQVKGFRTTGIRPAMRYFVYSEPIGRFIFDGIDAQKFHIPVSELLANFTSKDILGIEVMYKAFTSNYESNFLSANEIMRKTFPIPFIEITTRSGSGPFLRKTASAFAMYKPPFLASGKTFYEPAYLPNKGMVSEIDLRSTLYWDAGVDTDNGGYAALSFFTGSTSGDYIITVEGTDMKGNIVCDSATLHVK